MLGPFPILGWFGVVAALLFLAAILVVSIKGLVKPRLGIKSHRTLALRFSICISPY